MRDVYRVVVDLILWRVQGIHVSTSDRKLTNKAAEEVVWSGAEHQCRTSLQKVFLSLRSGRVRIVTF